MRVAIIGTGISGLVVAYKLHKKHSIDLFEANDYVGGHTNTITTELLGQRYSVDTGFIVFNNWTYPNFTKLLEELQVNSQKSNMGFSVSSALTGLEYCGSSLNGLFAQRRNLANPKFYHFLLDIVRFNKKSIQILNQEPGNLTLGNYLQSQNYSREFINNYIIPMGAAIWSTDPANMLEFPAHTFVRFFKNHGLLNIKTRPTWYTITGGSKKYVDSLTKPFLNKIHLNSAIKQIIRHQNHVELYTEHNERHTYDAVFIATHSDQALSMLSKPSTAEKEILGSIHYQKNEAVLHTDETLLPKRRTAWAAWNYHIPSGHNNNVVVTYNMNILQNIKAPRQFCVTLNNRSSINPDAIIKSIQYEHPLYNVATINAQQRWPEINGQNNTYYCGAYWGYGFHEDGVNSALRTCKTFEDQQ